MTSKNIIRFGFVGDVMIGRGIDAILPFSVDGMLHESYMKDANGYVNIAERATGPLPKVCMEKEGFSYIWGDVRNDLKSADALIVNLESSLTESNDWDRNKGIHYRSHPRNAESLSTIDVDVATLANNHVMDWGDTGLKETLTTLTAARIKYAGAGSNIEEASAPTFLQVPVSDVEMVTIAIIAVGFPSAGVPLSWKATQNKGGVNVKEEVNRTTAREILSSVHRSGEKGGCTPDFIVVSLHWGPNWAWGTPPEWREFAHELVDLGADAVIGHSSHHVKGVEVYKGKFIAYGLGDFLNDYEGIVGQGFEDYRNDLSCIYFPSVDLETKLLVGLEILPCKIKHLKVQRARDKSDINWLMSTFNKEGLALGTSCEAYQTPAGCNNLLIKW